MAVQVPVCLDIKGGSSLYSAGHDMEFLKGRCRCVFRKA